jgi:hypothetical protein
MSDLVAVGNHIAKSLKTTPERLTVSMAAESELVFLGYLAQSRLSPGSKAKLSASRNALVALRPEVRFLAR